MTLFGGEPLLEKEKILKVFSSLYPYFEKKDIVFSSDIITNGILLTRDFEEEIVNYGLNTIVITLDGSPDVHNKKRVFKNGEPTFDIILENIIKVKDIAKFHINVNIDEMNNMDEISELLNMLKRNNLQECIKRIDFKPIVNGEIIKCGITSFRNANLDKLIGFRKLAKALGFSVLNQPVFGPCDIYFKNSFVIDVNGDIYKCAALIGNKKYVVGSIYNSDGKELDFFKLPENNECLDCKFLPVCYSGCRYSAYLETGDINNISCEKEFYHNFLNALYS
jgi:uncharacterized protein